MKIYNKFYTETKATSIDRNLPKCKRGKKVLKINSDKFMRSNENNFLYFLCEKMFYLPLLVCESYLFIYFPVGTLGRSHRQNNFQ